MFNRTRTSVWMIMLMVMLTVFSTCIPALAASYGNNTSIFIDVTSNYWANSAIDNMVSSGIIKGYPDKTFKPGKPVAREEFAVLICKSFYLDLVSPASPSFYDVQPDSWSYKYIETAKEFLTGYYPPKGKAFFNPMAKATREDVAVALVKVLDYTPDDLENLSLLEEKFTDVDSISPNLRDYVALAIEKNLFSGYPDGTFRGDAPVTRAEVATLLYKMIKSSTTDPDSSPLLRVSAPETIGSPTAYITGTTNKNCKVTINNKSVEVNEGEFRQDFTFQKEGVQEFVIVAKDPWGITTTVTKTIKYEIAGPELTLDDVPITTTSETITVSGSAVDASGYGPKVYVNNKEVGEGTFSTTITLTEGTNTVVIKAVNRSGKSTAVTRIVTFDTGGPTLTLDNVPATSLLDTITVSGRAEDINDNKPKVYLNNKEVGGGAFSATITLTEGANTLVFRAVNKFGKSISITKTVNFSIGAPDLIIDYIPENTTAEVLTISGRASDPNDTRPKLYLNGGFLGEGSFSKTITLVEGTNTLVFTATDKFGKITTVTKTVMLSKVTF